MAANPSVISYIREQMEAGFRKEQIYEALLQVGWYREEIDEAFREMAEQRYSKPQPEEAPKPEKGKGFGKKKIIALVLAALAVALAALYFLNIFDSVSFISGLLNLSAILGEKGDVQTYNNQYSYDGTLSLSLKNGLGRPITISSVSSDCGGQGRNVVLETTDPTTLGPDSSASYSTGDEKCLAKDPGERYSVSVSVRYLEGGNLLKMSVLQIEGNVL